MIGIDTNVLLRHLVHDDAGHAARAARFFRERSPDDPAYISTAVVVETVSVLRRHYRVEQESIRVMLEALLRSRDVVVESSAALRRALEDSREVNGDVADAIIAHAAIGAGADGAVTFDRRAQRLPGMLPLR